MHVLHERPLLDSSLHLPMSPHIGPEIIAHHSVVVPIESLCIGAVYVPHAAG